MEDINRIGERSSDSQRKGGVPMHGTAERERDREVEERIKRAEEINERVTSARREKKGTYWGEANQYRV